MIATLLAIVSTPGHAEVNAFLAARPIWPEDREKEMNLSVGFRAVVDSSPAKRTTLRVAAATIYRALVNGEFAAHGPARACHGYYRVDEWDITRFLTRDANVVTIEVAGYNANSYAYLDQPSFLQAEVVRGNRVIAATGGAENPFEAAILTERIQKVHRYSFQRPFVEAYELGPRHAQWYIDPAATREVVNCAEAPKKRLLPRRVPYPRFAVRPALRHVLTKSIRVGPPGEGGWGRGPARDFKAYSREELTRNIAAELRGLAATGVERVDATLQPDSALELAAGQSHILDLGTNLTGFIGATVECREATRLCLLFDEIMTGSAVNWQRMGCLNAVTYDLEPGTYRLESIEPYTLRYTGIVAVRGRCVISNVHIREYANPDVAGAQFAASDQRLEVLFEAGRETFAQNAVDVFMDCPSRERAGWLCDSFFTARTAAVLSGNTVVETAFIENYLLPERFEHLPDGMLPMCYPSDHPNGNFIPNWALWFLVQLEEYVARSGDVETAEALKPKVMALLEYLRGFENHDGLLERLERWVFIEWSEANKFVQDVNYPSNMLYAGALSAAGRLYDMPDLEEHAEALRETVREQSYDGEFFVDNAVREDGELRVTGNRSEVCQYYAFFFDVATPESHPELWRTLVEDFGPDRGETGAHAEVHPANAFIGNMLRFELLSEAGRGMQILDESMGYLLYMAERTGTLWENVDDRASCNHGFASHICFTLYRDILGAYEIDPVSRELHLRFTDVGLEWCEGTIPVRHGVIGVSWRRGGQTLRYQALTPAGWSVEVENLSGLELVRER